MKAAVFLVASAVAIAQSPAPPAAMMTQDSVNVFRRFSADRAKELAFYRDAIGLLPLNALNMPGGGQMSLFSIATSQFKFTSAESGRASKSGDVLDVIGLRVFTFFFKDEDAVTRAFTTHGFPAPDFHGPQGGRHAMVSDPDGQWCELVVGYDPPIRFELGATVKDLERSRLFYRDFVGLEELPAVEMTDYGKTYRFKLGQKSEDVLNLWAAHPGAAVDNYTAGIQYVVRDVDAVDARAKANHITITQPLGMFGQGLKTVWLADPDGITNYFAQILRPNRQVNP